MKPQYLASASLLAALFCLLCCKKDPTSNAKLPDATQEGRNTVGFTIDGEVWVPYAKCGFGRNPCGQIQARYSTPSAALNGIDFGFDRQNIERVDKFSAIIITSNISGTITTIGDKKDSISVIYQSEAISGNSGIYYGPLANRPKKFLITRIDPVNQIISGEFEFVLQEQVQNGREITIKDGRFDLRFNACVCSH